MDSEVLRPSHVFRPLPFLTSGWAQTVGAVLWPQLPDLKPTASHLVSLPDGDRLCVIENRPCSWQTGNRIVVLVHGLTGSSASKDVVRLCRKLVEHGLLTMRVNLRGCGPGFGLARNLYHSGRSEDLREVIRWLAQSFPTSPVTQVGISLGGNITLKMAGEDGPDGVGRLDSIVAVSAPIDLAACARRMEDPDFRFFDQYFVGVLRKHVARLHRHFPDLPSIEFPETLTLRQFDDLYTAPRCGFRDAADYYARSSSGPLLPQIHYRSLVLCAADDPVVDARCYANVATSDRFQLIVTPQGGHVGFLGGPGKPWYSVRWMDNLILNWIQHLPAPLCQSAPQSS